MKRAANWTIRADVLHLSPPCQYFSPAHTQESANDEENIFALFGCRELINKVRPRLVTLEQTFGITHDRHASYLWALIGDMTDQGYSVRWKVIRLCTWGLAQDRKRLIMIAAAPGERLPPFPHPTHAQTGDAQAGVVQFRTINDEINRVSVGDDLHNLHQVKKYSPRKAPYDGDRLAGTITTSGSTSYHPSGKRSFTLREYACLQSFPKMHRFKGTSTAIKRQIGNAFPPKTVEVLYRHLQEWLLEQDSIHPGEDVTAQAIVIEDDSDVSEDSLSPLSSLNNRGPPEMYDVLELEDDSGNTNMRTATEVDAGTDCEMIDLTGE